MAAHLPRRLAWASCRSPNLQKVICSPLHQGSTVGMVPPFLACHSMRPTPPAVVASSHHDPSLLKPFTVQHSLPLLCSAKSSVRTTNENPFGFLFPSANITSQISNIDTNINNSIITADDKNSISCTGASSLVDKIQPALQILQISENLNAIRDPGSESPVVWEMGRKNGFQHRKRMEKTRMNKHKRRKRMKRDAMVIKEVKEIRMARKVRRRAKMKAELVEKLEKLALYKPRYAELRKKKPHIKWRLESW